MNYLAEGRHIWLEKCDAANKLDEIKAWLNEADAAENDRRISFLNHHIIKTTSTFGKWNWTKMAERTLQNRLGGFYCTDETREEARYCARHLEPNEVAITIINRLGQFSAYSKDLFAAQVKLWKKNKCELLDCNIKSIDLPEIKNAVLITIHCQMQMCPYATSQRHIVSW